MSIAGSGWYSLRFQTMRGGMPNKKRSNWDGDRGIYGGSSDIAARLQRLLQSDRLRNGAWSLLFAANPIEGVAERKIRQRQLTEDGNIEVTGRDLREGSLAVSRDAP